MPYLIVDVIRFIVSFILLATAARAFLKTKSPAMFYLALGFAFITLGHLFSDIYFYNNTELNMLNSEIFDIIGLISLIVAIKKA